jgi:hypothetical protein
MGSTGPYNTSVVKSRSAGATPDLDRTRWWIMTRTDCNSEEGKLYLDVSGKPVAKSVRTVRRGSTRGTASTAVDRAEFCRAYDQRLSEPCAHQSPRQRRVGPPHDSDFGSRPRIDAAEARSD